jgi:hypothetical protein
MSRQPALWPVRRLLGAASAGLRGGLHGEVCHKVCGELVAGRRGDLRGELRVEPGAELVAAARSLCGVLRGGALSGSFGGDGGIATSKANLTVYHLPHWRK